MPGPETPMRGHLLHGYLQFYNSQQWTMAKPEPWIWQHRETSTMTAHDPSRRRKSMVGRGTSPAEFEIFGMVVPLKRPGFLMLRRPTWANVGSADREFAVHYDKQLVTLSKAMEENGVNPYIGEQFYLKPKAFAPKLTLQDKDEIVLTYEGGEFQENAVLFATVTLAVSPSKTALRREFYTLQVKEIRGLLKEGVLSEMVITTDYDTSADKATEEAGEGEEGQETGDDE
ncbi:hypothetical protein R3P38DRAFT_3239934 [Favolaschia claudopus]|uniref:Uncharacterized protein n=1 Tax=Favolaschia claudopus TaxID=2862362 RepID=A0AAV9Z7D7_9AGAR